jgi:hypothetical protein
VHAFSFTETKIFITNSHVNQTFVFLRHNEYFQNQQDKT